MGQPMREGHQPCWSPTLSCVWGSGFAPRPAWQVSSEGVNGAPVAGPEFPARTALKCVIPLGSNTVQTLAGTAGRGTALSVTTAREHSPGSRRPPRPTGRHSSRAQTPCGHAAVNRPLSVTVPSCSESSARPCPRLQGAESGPSRHAPPSASGPPVGTRQRAMHLRRLGHGPPPVAPARCPRTPGHKQAAVCLSGRKGLPGWPQGSEALSTPVGQPQSCPRMTMGLGAATACQGILKH